MTKKYFHTYDTFEFKDRKINKSCLDFCIKKALKSGLKIKIKLEKSPIEFHMYGTKLQFIKYYFSSLSKCHELEDFKRALSTLSW